MTSTRDMYRRRQARRSTVTGVGGVGLMALGFGLTYFHVAGYLVPTLIALAGLVSLITGIAIGSQLVMDNIRYQRSQSFYDDE